MTARRKPIPVAQRRLQEALDSTRNQVAELEERNEELRKTRSALSESNRDLLREVGQLKVANVTRTTYRIDFVKRSIGWTAKLYEVGEMVARYGPYESFWSLSRKRAGAAAAHTAYQLRYKVAKPIDHGPSVTL